MSETNETPQKSPKFSLDKLPRTSEGRFFSLFIALAVLRWSIGITSFQMNELKVKREIAAAKKAEDDAKALRLKALNVAYTNSKFNGFEYHSGGDFRYKFDTKSNCKGSRSCAFPIILSKYNCDSVDLTFTFTKASGDIVSTVNTSESYVSSLSLMELYIESSNNKDIDYVNFVSATCNGKSY